MNRTDFSQIPLEVYAKHFDIHTRIKLMTVSKGFRKQFQKLYNEFNLVDYEKQVNNKRQLHVLYVDLNDNFLKLYEIMLMLRLFHVPMRGQLRINISHRFLRRICRFSNIIPLFVGIVLDSVNKYLKNCRQNISAMNDILISTPRVDNTCKDIRETFLQINDYVDLVSKYIKLTEWDSNQATYNLFIKKVLVVLCLIFNIMYLEKIQEWRHQFGALDSEIQLEQHEIYLLSSRASYGNLLELQ